MVSVHPNEELVNRVERALDQIRPYMEADGGNVKLLSISDDLVVQLELLGACGSCPMSAMTMKAGVEQSILRAVPEIKAVNAINMIEPGQ